MIYGLVAVACNIIVMGWFYWYISVPLAIVINLVIVWVQHVDIKLRYFAQQRGLDAKKLKWVWDFESGEQYMEIYNEARHKKYLPEEMKEFALPLWPIYIGAVVALAAFFTGGYKFIPCY